LIRQIKTKPVKSKSEQIIWKYIPFNINKTEQPPITITINITYNFIDLFIHLFSSQSLRTGPNTLFDRSHSCQRLEDLTKQVAATIKKGVVGKMGKKIPVNPNPTNIKPNTLKTLSFINFIFLNKK